MYDGAAELVLMPNCYGNIGYQGSQKNDVYIYI